jgi:hypothetical protein
MPPMTTTPNMSLQLPVIGQNGTPGPFYGTFQNNSFGLIDAHDHSLGKGVQLDSGAFNLTTDLSFNSTASAVDLFSLQLVPQTAPLAGSYIGTISNVLGDLYYNNGGGTPVQITSGASLHVVGSGISDGGTSTASFVASVLVVDMAISTPANIQAGSILLGNNVSGTNYVTLSPGTSTTAYTLVLPTTVPSTPSFLTVSATGGTATLAYTTQAAGITYSNIQVTNTVFGSGGANSFIFPPNSTVGTVTITGSGRPIQISMQPVVGATAQGLVGSGVQLKRGSTVLIATTASNSIFYQQVYTDNPGAGTFTYTVFQTASGAVSPFVFIAREVL